MENRPAGLGPISKPKMSLKMIAIIIAVVVVISGVSVFLYSSVLSKHSSTTGPAKYVTISVWGSGDPGGETTAFNSLLNAFETAYPNITVSDNPAEAPATSNFFTYAHAGNAPDVFRDTSDNGGLLFYSGLILNMSKYFNASFFSQFTSRSLKDWSYNGAYYGVPVNVNGIGLYYNTALLPNGVPPANLYQMVQDAIAVQSRGGSYTGFPYDIGGKSGYRFASFLPAFGGELFNSSHYPMLNSSAAVQAMSFLWNLTVKYGVDPKGVTLTIEKELFEEGYSPFILEGPWDQSLFENALGSKLGVEPIPYNNATGKWPLPLWGSIGYVVSSPNASGANSSQIWASLQFVKFMTDYNAQLTLYKDAGDMPAMKSVQSYIENDSLGDPLTHGWLAQENESQAFPNYIQINYYWAPFLIGATDLEENSSSVTVADVMNVIESHIISDLNEYGIPYLDSAPAHSLLKTGLYYNTDQAMQKYSVITQFNDISLIFQAVDTSLLQR